MQTALKITEFQFESSCGITYVHFGPDRVFVGRWKYSRPAANARDEVRWIIKNLTRAEFVAAISEGRTALNDLLRARGYVGLNARSVAARRAA